MFNKKNTLIISCCWGLLGVIRTTYKEMYRLEVIIRGIEHEKNKDYYYELL